MKTKGKKNGCIAALAVAMSLTLTACGSSSKETKLDPDNPVTVTVWNYYNGYQLSAFEKAVEKFNSGVGKDKGVVVVSTSQGDINTLADSLLDSVSGKAGAQKKPTLASVYSETAYILNEKKALSSYDQYFDDSQLESIIPGFLDEGRFNKNDDLLLYPITKSTEVFSANETDWEPFAKDTGITLDSIKTNEDLTKAAKAYYEWTDKKTPSVANDGKALYGRDSVANYIYLGCYQLGHPMFTVDKGKLKVDIDHDTFKTLWDNYYIPYINGYFTASAKFRSEDTKTGKILSLTSSSSSAGYLPAQVTEENDATHSINMITKASLQFKNAKNDSVVQQGASYCLLKSDEAQEEGAAEFLKWFSKPKQNLAFATESGYSPVSVKSNTKKAIKDAYTGDTSTAKGKNTLDALVASAQAFSKSTAYATKPFNGSKDVRSYFESTLQKKAVDDRKEVENALASGSSQEQAVAKFSSQDYFEEWFKTVKTDVDKLVKS